MVATTVAAVLFVLGGIAVDATGRRSGPVERHATVAGEGDSIVLGADFTTTTVAPASAPAPPTTRPPATTLVTSSTVVRTGAAVVPPPTVAPPPLPTTTSIPPLPTTIAVAPYPPNGPALPVVSVRLSAQLPDGTVTVVAGEVQDLDGWIRDVKIDWGDGTPPVSLDMSLDGGPCPMAGGFFPAGSLLSLPPDKSFHRYAGPAPRTITVTAASTSCDGVSDRQTAVGRVILSAPAAQ